MDKIVFDVEFNGKLYPYSWGLGSMLNYEVLMGQAFTPEFFTESSMMKTTVMHYSCFRNGGDSFHYSFAEFVRIADPNKALMQKLNETLAKCLEIWNQDNAAVTDDESEDEEKEKEQKKSSK